VTVGNITNVFQTSYFVAYFQDHSHAQIFKKMFYDHTSRVCVLFRGIP